MTINKIGSLIETKRNCQVPGMCSHALSIKLILTDRKDAAMTLDNASNMDVPSERLQILKC